MARRKFRRVNEVLQAKLGEAVRSRRQNLGITQEELAWRADLHRTYVADIERGVRNVTLRSLGSLAQALKTSVVGLLTHARAFGVADEAKRAPVEALDPAGDILFVEDDPADVELTLEIFDQAGITNPVQVARDGLEALDYIFCSGPFANRSPSAYPRLVLLDLHLPKISGVEVLRRLKSNEKTRSIPVIVLTASRRDSDVAECRRLGAANYIVKPVQFGKLCKITPRLSLRWELRSPLAAKRAEPV